MRLVLDTNVVMSAIFFGGDPKIIVRAAIAKKVGIMKPHEFKLLFLR